MIELTHIDAEARKIIGAFSDDQEYTTLVSSLTLRNLMESTEGFIRSHGAIFHLCSEKAKSGLYRIWLED